ncbi:hypothetical protein NMG60_11020103 [Bertholletia excelsa]
MDFTWWSDYILAVAKRSGAFTMIDVLSGARLLEKDPLYSMPILERVQQSQGHLFLLENTSSEEGHDLSNKKAASDLPHMDLVTEDVYKRLDMAKLRWTLLSFSKRSVSEMYNVLISRQMYEAALDFAKRYGLDTDEVYKSQWLHSVQGTNDINMFLSVIKDTTFVLNECVDRVGPTEDAMRALIEHGLDLTNQYRFLRKDIDENSQIWEFRLARLRLLQFRDKLETFLGINMGRFSVQEYSKFRDMPISEAAVVLAESGKIGALNLLFKRHPYSLSPFTLEILSAIPETVPVQSYGQLLPGNTPPLSVYLREKDWVECQEMVTFISRNTENGGSNVQLRTELIIKEFLGFSWPSLDELSRWYKNRARDMDRLSGQLDNSLALIDFACCKGICELKQFRDDISYLHQLIYSDGSDEVNFIMTLVEWEELSDYEKFKMMIKGVKEENVVERLREKALPFMQYRLQILTGSGDAMVADHFNADEKADSFLVRWLKEIAIENKLDICLKVIEEGCRDLQSRSIFKDKAEAVECALQCIYLCTTTDRWSTMTSILSKLPEVRDSEVCVEGLKKRLKLAEGHIEAGRLLSLYQVPKPINFFLEADSDGKSVKQILRLILSKFVRRQPGHSDHDWANMWRDLQSLQEKAFPFLDQEYMLMEFCRGLLKAGKFSLARNYLRGTASVALATEKAEMLVIQAAREYFFSASSLTSSEIWKARECLGLFPNSRNVRAEVDIIDALTVKLPTLGVNILPLQFRQIKDPMEIIKLAITSQAGAYLNVDELTEIAKLLGLNSQDEISAVQEAIAREAAVAGDLQLAFDLCVVLAKKGHGSVWDLCAAMARGPELEKMDINSRKRLLGFALSYCDEESIGELMHAWKDLDMQGQCETLMVLTGTDPPKFSFHGSSIISFPLQSSQDMVHLREYSGQVDGISHNDQEVHIKDIKEILALVAKDLSKENGSNLETLLQENGKILSFAALQLPWLLEMCRREDCGKKLSGGSISGKEYITIRTQAVMTILSWLARNDFAPRDDLIASLAKSIIEPPVTEEEDVIGSSFLLNLMDAFHGVEVIEEQVKMREAYNEICSIMSVGMIYSLLHNSTLESDGPTQRRELLLQMFKEKHISISSDELDTVDKAQPSFWRDWKLKLAEQKRVADHSRILEQIIPGVETSRFLSGDANYIESVVFSLVESVKLEKKHILKDLLKLTHTYGLNQTKVLLQYLSSVLTSEVWTIDDIKAEISGFRNEIVACAAGTIKKVSLSVYPSIDGCDKQRLAYVYGLLSDCYLQLKETKELAHITIDVAQFYKVIEEECNRVAFIRNLNFKNIAELHGFNLKFFRHEIYSHIDNDTVGALATMVQNLLSICKEPVPQDLISLQDVYCHHVLSLLEAFEGRFNTETSCGRSENLSSFLSELEKIYNVCRKYMTLMAYPDIMDIMKRFFRVILTCNKSFEGLSNDSTFCDSLIFLSNFWLRLFDDMQKLITFGSPEEKCNLECLVSCLKVFTRLLSDGKVSPSQGWGTILGYANHSFTVGFASDTFNLCRAMVFSGCGFVAISEIYSRGVSELLISSHAVVETERHFESMQDLPHLYVSILETILQSLAADSSEHWNLHQLLSSLSRLDGDLEDLKRIRRAVWERMTKFSDDLTLPSHVRVYALELMQFLTAAGRNVKEFSSELQSNVLPWEGWDDFISSTSKSETTISSLVALKSSQLVQVISPSIEIRPEDLSTVDSAVSCFLKLCKDATSETQVDTLIAILGEWEGLYTVRKDELNSVEVAEAANDWSDDWDDGWESFQEGSIAKETKDGSLSVHPLHMCWTEIFKKMAMSSRFRDLFKLIDQALVKSNGILLDQVDADTLSQIVLQMDCFVALKLALLFPYEAIQLQCLDVVEDKLNKQGISAMTDNDHELLILVLSSGIISTIISRSSHGTVFSFLCCMVGNFSHWYQEAQLSNLKRKGKIENERSEKDFLLIFRTVTFPCFLSELVKANQQILAGLIVARFMHTNASLSLINVAEASLKRYLERQLGVLQGGEESYVDMGIGEPLVNTISQMKGRLESLIQSAISSLTGNR